MASGEHSQTAPLITGAGVPASEAGNANEITGLVYIPDRDLIGVLKSPSELRLFDANTLTAVGGWSSDMQSASAICHIPMGPGYFAFGSSAGLIRIYEVETEKLVATIPVSSIVSSLRYSTKNNLMCAGFWDGSTQAWPIAPILAGSPTAGHRFKAHSGRTLAVDLSPDGEWLASGGRDCTIRLSRWPTQGGSNLTPLEAPPQVLKFSPCGRWLLVCERIAGQQARLTVAEVQTGRAFMVSRCLGALRTQSTGLALTTLPSIGPGMSSW